MAKRWLLIEYNHAWVDATLKVVCETNTACHLWLLFTEHPERMHLRTGMKRGLPSLHIADFCFTAYQSVEQQEAGDTLYHTFIFGGWAPCQRRWWFIYGKIGGGWSNSTSCIFTAHYGTYEADESLRHIDLTDKEVAGVIDHANGSVSDPKLATPPGLNDGNLCKLPVAVQGQVLTRGPAQWQAGTPTAGVLQLIATAKLTSPSAKLSLLTLNTSTFSHLILLIRAKAPTNSRVPYLRLNNLSTAVYYFSRHYAVGATPGAISMVTQTAFMLSSAIADSSSFDTLCNLNLHIDASQWAILEGTLQVIGSTTGNPHNVRIQGACGVGVSTYITQIDFYWDTGNVNTGATIELYGIPTPPFPYPVPPPPPHIP